MNIIILEGIVNNIKVRDIEKEGKASEAKFVTFGLSTRSADPARYQDKKAREFWNVEIYVPGYRAGVLQYLVNGAIVQISGTPYKTEAKDGKPSYTNVRANLDQLEFHGSIERDEKDNSNKSEQSQGGQQQAANAGGKQGW